MSNIRRPFAFTTTLAVTLAAALLAGACDRDAGPASSSASVGDRDYRIAGEVVRLPDERDPQVWIRHAAIPDFVDAEGNRVGMESMIMPFPLAPGLDAAGLTPGDRIAFTLAMRWNDRPANAITAIEPLPAGEALPWDPAPEADADPGAAPADADSQSSDSPR